MSHHDMPRGFCRWCGVPLGPYDYWFYWLHSYHKMCWWVKRNEEKKSPLEIQDEMMQEDALEIRR